MSDSNGHANMEAAIASVIQLLAESEANARKYHDQTAALRVTLALLKGENPEPATTAWDHLKAGMLARVNEVAAPAGFAIQSFTVTEADSAAPAATEPAGPAKRKYTRRSKSKSKSNGNGHGTPKVAYDDKIKAQRRESKDLLGVFSKTTPMTREALLEAGMDASVVRKLGGLFRHGYLKKVKSDGGEGWVRTAREYTV